MTDFLNDAYGNRCFDIYREVRKVHKKFLNEGKELPTNHPLLLKFHTCLYRPFLNITMHEKLRTDLNSCLVESEEDYSKCENYVNELRKIGSLEAQENVFFDVHSTVKVQGASNQCKENLNKARELMCDAFPEKHECVELKEKTFACISRVACSELHTLSSECFKKNEQMESDSLWKYLFKGQDVQTKKSYEQYCSSIQSDLIRCFDKYFLLGIVMKSSTYTPEGLDEQGYFYGAVTPDDLKKRQKALEKRIRYEKEQDRRYREQQKN
ncbi:hypothetical protein C9374_001230 [Naegleria lovaniensis]|uniref:Uncharacterized protein n=1 Tax=Naegleria lovaniensis TaxID=51637 RepID=A0AA88GXA3_NAELO|nr:uncharacterized protein C9374_001230 [Naegleria lovaniensis]KAG2387636.1 hypothetical protein C9374_001230 [Naegleria lovaniensis]